MRRKTLLVAFVNMLILGMVWVIVGCGGGTASTETTASNPQTTASSAVGSSTTVSSTASSAATSTAQPSGEPIVIGAAVAMSGFLVPYDQPPLAFAQMAVADVNAQGGVMGKALTGGYRRHQVRPHPGLDRCS